MVRVETAWVSAHKLEVGSQMALTGLWKNAVRLENKISTSIIMRLNHLVCFVKFNCMRMVTESPGLHPSLCNNKVQSVTICLHIGVEGSGANDPIEGNARSERFKPQYHQRQSPGDGEADERQFFPQMRYKAAENRPTV